MKDSALFNIVDTEARGKIMFYCYSHSHEYYVGTYYFLFFKGNIERQISFECDKDLSW